jgi:hypothetical protein
MNENYILLNRQLSKQIKHVYGSEKIDCNADEFIVICLVKNGALYIEQFIEHYLSLWAKQIFFIDNNSADDTIDLITRYPAVSMYTTELLFKQYENVIRQIMINYEGFQ